MSVNESDDYKRGWQRGYNDGFTAAKKSMQVLMTAFPSPTAVGRTCSKCSKVYLPYSCCPQADCPIQPYMKE